MSEKAAADSEPMGAAGDSSAQSGCVAWIGFDELRQLRGLWGSAAAQRYLALMCGRIDELDGARVLAANAAGEAWVWVPAADRLTAFERICEIRQLLQEPVEFGERCLLPNLRIGWASAPDDGSDLASLCRKADLAGGGLPPGSAATVAFDASMDLRADTELGRPAALRAAVESGAIELHYQAIVDPHTHAVTGVEALARWRIRSRLLLPSEFLPACEAAGLMGELGTRLLDRALGDYARLERAAGHPLRLAYNLGATQLQDPNFLNTLRQLLAQHRVPPSQLEFELSEQLEIRHPDRLRLVRALGVRLAIDDFGSGLSNLARLFSLPIGRVKLDRSLTARLAMAAKGDLHLADLDQLVRSIGARMTIEGIERHSELVLARGLREVEVQGYLVHRPSPLAGIESWLGSRLAPAATPR